MASPECLDPSQEHADCCAQRCVAQWLSVIKTLGHRKSKTLPPLSLVPRTSEARQTASLHDVPLANLESETAIHNAVRSDTVLYLGYGSNMCRETFRGKRGIRPISQVNVVVPTLSLTFDLPGVPYTEPCFGNVRYRDIAVETDVVVEEKASGALERLDYHKDRWKKGLVGVVYEVTTADFAHIIATEGGGASYKDVVVDCYALGTNPNDDVPDFPSNKPFKTHTLFSPTRVVRPKQSWAQPSPRYLKLITDGADELALPFEYQDFLKDIGTYQATTARQRLGQFIFLSIWSPVFLFLFGGASVFLDKDGKFPVWYAKLAAALFQACWGSYDDFFKPAFGEGERTVGKGDEENLDMDTGNEKTGLLWYNQRSYDAVRPDGYHPSAAVG